MQRTSLRLSTAALALLLAVPAFAHSKPKVMTPDKGATVSAPSTISVVFTEALEPKFSSLSLLDEKGTVLSKVPSKVDPADAKHMTLDAPLLAPGVYTVHWVTAAADDGHKMQGDYTFTVK